MIDRETAERLVKAEFRRRDFPDDVVLLVEHTIERPFGWVFFYNTRRFVETGDHRFGLVGNAPFIVDRRDGSVHPTTTSRPIGEIIRQYEASRPPDSGP